MFIILSHDVFTAGSGKKGAAVPQQEEEKETTDYGKAVAKLKEGEKKQRVAKVCNLITTQLTLGYCWCDNNVETMASDLVIKLCLRDKE